MNGRSWWAFVAGLVVVTAVGVADLIVESSLVAAMLVGVVVAALAGTPAQVAVVAVWAVLWATLLGHEGERWTAEHWLRIGALLVGSVVAVMVAANRARDAATLARTTEIADVAQRALLQEVDGTYGAVDLTVRYLSAAEGALIGGDLYHAEDTPWGLRVIVADVCGHGLETVDRAASLVAAFRLSAHSSASLEELAADLDGTFTRDPGPSDFASAVLLQISGRDVEWISCGHPDPLLVSSGDVSWLAPETRSRPLGLGPTPTSRRLRLTGGDRLLVYTDGLVDARDADGRAFDLGAWAVASAGGSVPADLDALRAALLEHTGGGLTDDVVMLAVDAH